MLKKYIILGLAIASSAVMSCNPLEDINDQFDAIQDDKDDDTTFNLERIDLPEDLVYTLEEADYKRIGGEVGKMLAFTDVNKASNFMPKDLTENFDRAKSTGTVLTVIYDSHSEESLEDGSFEKYSFVDEDYAGFGGNIAKYKNFNTKDVDSHLPVFLANKFPYAVEGKDLIADFTVRMTQDKFQQYEYKLVTIDEVEKNMWVRTDNSVTEFDYEDFYEVKQADYDSLSSWNFDGDLSKGPGKYDNFSSRDKAENYLPQLLDEIIETPTIGQLKTVKFAYNGNFTMYNNYVLKGGDWTNNDKVNIEYQWSTDKVIVETLNEKSEEFAYITGKKWVADESEKIELVKDDYKVTGDDKYSNFDLRKLSEQDIIERCGKILETNYSEKVSEDKVFTVIYKSYDGSNGIGKARIKKNSDGAWVKAPFG